MNIVSFVKPHFQAAELMQQGHRLLDHIANPSKSATMLGVAFGDERLDAFVPKRLTMRLAVVAAVAIDFIGCESRGADLAANGRDRVDQRQKLGVQAQ